MTKVINTINDDILSENICFIPTMGAIHEGHLSLVDIGKETNLKTLVSIFLIEDNSIMMTISKIILSSMNKIFNF